jgi:osmotically-inducible protein OsmY
VTRVLHSLTSTALGIAFLLTVSIPGVAQAQRDRTGYQENDLYNEPYPYFESRYDGENEYWFEDERPTDRELRREIMQDLSTSPFSNGDQIRVSVDRGIATLSGRVEDRSAMIDAVETAYDAGAMRVRNNLRPQGWEDRPWVDMRDRELRDDIEDELAFSPFVNSDRIEVSVRNGVATLQGTVENQGEIADAVENAYEAGAKRVVSRLWVNPDLD